MITSCGFSIGIFPRPYPCREFVILTKIESRKCMLYYNSNQYATLSFIYCAAQLPVTLLTQCEHHLCHHTYMSSLSLVGRWYSCSSLVFKVEAVTLISTLFLSGWCLQGCWQFDFKSEWVMCILLPFTASTHYHHCYYQPLLQWGLTSSKYSSFRKLC